MSIIGYGQSHDAGALRFKAKLHQRQNRCQAVSLLTGLRGQSSVTMNQQGNWHVAAVIVLYARLSSLTHGMSSFPLAFALALRGRARSCAVRALTFACTPAFIKAVHDVLGVHGEGSRNMTQRLDRELF